MNTQTFHNFFIFTTFFKNSIYLLDRLLEKVVNMKKFYIFTKFVELFIAIFIDLWPCLFNTKLC